jgi:hypothetical protein
MIGLLLDGSGPVRRTYVSSSRAGLGSMDEDVRRPKRRAPGVWTCRSKRNGG